MTIDTRLLLFLMGELVVALRANDVDLLNDVCLAVYET